MDMKIANTWLKKKENHLISYHSGGNKRIIDYALIPKKLFPEVIDVKVIPGEKCIAQHRLLVVKTIARVKRRQKERMNMEVEKQRY